MEQSEQIELIKSTMKSAHIDALLNDWLPEEKVSLYSTPKLGTAYWSYQPPHKIVIGEDILTRTLIKDTKYYIESFVYHELSHALWTERDTDRLNKELENNGVPFLLYNLFEDARIEELWRRKTGRAFKWASYEVTHTICNNAKTNEDIFFRIIQLEDSSKVTADIKNLERLKLVTEYYERVLEAKNSIEVIDICVDWLRDHPDAEANIKSSQIMLYRKDSTPDEVETIEGSATSSLIAGEPDGKPNNEQPAPVPYTDAHQCDLSAGNVAELFGKRKANIDQSEVMRLSKVFERILKKGSEKISTATPQKRLNIRAFTTGGDKFFSKRIKSDAVKGKKSFAVIVDCSGSMQGQPLEEGRVLLSVLNQLAKASKIECDVILSAISHKGQHLCATYRLPVDEDLFAYTQTSNCEGFAMTIDKTLPLLKASDYVFVYTDGCIGDEPNKSYAHKHGIYTYGLYAGKRDMSAQLLEYFDCAVSRPSIEEVINALISKIK